MEDGRPGVPAPSRPPLEQQELGQVCSPLQGWGRQFLSIIPFSVPASLRLCGVWGPLTSSQAACSQVKGGGQSQSSSFEDVRVGIGGDGDPSRGKV